MYVPLDTFRHAFPPDKGATIVAPVQCIVTTRAGSCECKNGSQFQPMLSIFDSDDLVMPNFGPNNLYSVLSVATSGFAWLA
jgi:hypothetical protein